MTVYTLYWFSRLHLPACIIYHFLLYIRLIDSVNMELFKKSLTIILLTNLQIKVQSEKFTCGRRLINHEALIVNGYASKEGDWPWHTAILHIGINQNIEYKCGGTLLNSHSVLTAAHCVYENDRPIVPDRVLVQLARNNLKVSGTHSQDIEVKPNDSISTQI